MTLPSYMKPFKYKVPNYGRPNRARRIEEAKEDGELTGMVNGEPASDIEERFAIALRNANLDFSFQIPVWTAYSLPYEQKQVDFMVWEPPGFPIEVDGFISHKTAGDLQDDMERDALIDEVLSKEGRARIQRVDGDRLADQDAANAVVGEMF